MCDTCPPSTHPSHYVASGLSFPVENLHMGCGDQTNQTPTWEQNTTAYGWLSPPPPVRPIHPHLSHCHHAPQLPWAVSKH